jgi:hypothetical protein
LAVRTSLVENLHQQLRFISWKGFRQWKGVQGITALQQHCFQYVEGSDNYRVCTATRCWASDSLKGVTQL